MEDNKKYVNMTASASFSPHITLGELLRQIQQSNVKSSTQVKNQTAAEVKNK